MQFIGQEFIHLVFSTGIAEFQVHTNTYRTRVLSQENTK
jgi:hypothetical protein